MILSRNFISTYRYVDDLCHSIHANIPFTYLFIQKINWQRQRCSGGSRSKIREMIVTETHLEELQPKSNFVPTGPWCQGQLIGGFCEEKCDRPDEGAWGWCHWSRCLRTGCSARLLPRPTGRIGPWHSSLWQELELVTRSRWCVATSLLLSTCMLPVWHTVISSHMRRCCAFFFYICFHYAHHQKQRWLIATLSFLLHRCCLSSLCYMVTILLCLDHRCEWLHYIPTINNTTNKPSNPPTSRHLLFFLVFLSGSVTMNLSTTGE